MCIQWQFAYENRVELELNDEKVGKKIQSKTQSKQIAMLLKYCAFSFDFVLYI